jgi:arylamine N-acetyltransferase
MREHGPDLDDDDVAAYLARLGVEREPPSAAALGRLHRAHAERIPYETLWIPTDDRWGILDRDSVRRIAHEGRGGYCFHLNGAFWALLRALGYDAHRHVGGVRITGVARAADVGNHLVLTVDGLPDDRAPDGSWYVDVGLGDTLHEPLPLRAGRYRQLPWELTLDAAPDGNDGDWLLTHDPLGGFPSMAWATDPAPSMAPFADQHVALSTDADSGFVRVFTAQLRDGTGVTVVRGLRFQRIGADPSEDVLDTPAALADALGDVFGLDLGRFSPSTRAALWDRLQRQHDAWSAEATGVPPTTASGQVNSTTPPSGGC